MNDIPLIPIKHDAGGEYVTVFLSSVADGNKHNFRCNNCGKLIFQYEGKVEVLVTNGDRPVQQPPLEIMCHRCKLVYRVI